jgi:threonine/homoserine/homoserine lactone efflux protein
VPTIENLIGWLLVSIVIIIIPGPGVTFVIARAMTIGRTGAVVTVFGHAAGVTLQILAVAFGLGALVASSAIAFNIMKFVGAGFLIYLGIRAVITRKQPIDLSLDGKVKTRKVVSDSFVVGITNAKTIVFFVATMPQFINPEFGNVPVQMLLLGAIFLVIGTLSDLVYAFAAGSARDWLVNSESRIAAVRAAGGVAIAGVGIHTALN